MGYRNKSYVISDGDEHILAYRFLRVWRANAQWTSTLAIFTTSSHRPTEFLTQNFSNLQDL